ncbi:B-box zinc finger 24-like [Olea europaea subsp. europaea]|uniref:B-box zinc finger 24-like n=1 Tax=Olea europaea subsp. europaea TaxID=158383 RepID=A0A8S0RKC6_OLEEU|nr:B-box zinc finger 24-like [Olea europaea subsp. europaea]
MKIQCDVCEKAQATVICYADEAALCAKCDIEVHAANKLASKHQRLLLQCLSNKLPPCDKCQEKSAFIFCVEDRALFCKDSDEPIHSANRLVVNHQRFLATEIQVSLNSTCNKDDPFSSTSPSWAINELLQFSNSKSSKKKDHLELGEFEWLTDMNLFGEQVGKDALATTELPQLQVSQPSNGTSYKQAKIHIPHKKPRLEIPDEDDDDDDEFFIVPDLG